MAVVGRVLFSTVIDRLNQRLASAISFASQAVALAIVIAPPSVPGLVVPMRVTFVSDDAFVASR